MKVYLLLAILVSFCGGLPAVAQVLQGLPMQGLGMQGADFSPPPPTPPPGVEVKIGDTPNPDLKTLNTKMSDSKATGTSATEPRAGDSLSGEDNDTNVDGAYLRAYTTSRYSLTGFQGPGPLPYGYVPGYTDDVEEEISSDAQEMILMEKPAFLVVPTLHDQIFNRELSNEFLFRYQQQFGFSEAEQMYFLTSRDGYYYSPSGLAPSVQDAQRMQFAEYMLKRLAEYHAENVLKNDPGLKKIYDIKQSVSNVKVDAGPDFKVDMLYSFVGNYFVTTIKTPKIETKVTVTMDPTQMIPTAPTEIYLQATKAITSTIRADGGITFYTQTVRGQLTKNLTPVLTVYVSELVPVSGFAYDSSREQLTMVGLGLIF